MILGFIDEFWGLGEVHFEVDTSLVKWCFVLPFVDTSGEYLCICDCDETMSMSWSVVVGEMDASSMGVWLVEL